TSSSLLGPEVHLFQQVAQLLRDLFGRISRQRRRNQTLCFPQRAALQGQRGGAPVQDGAGWLQQAVAGNEVGSAPLAVEGLAEPLPGQQVLPLAAGCFRLIHEPHRLLMEVLDLLHRCTTLARGPPNSTTNTYAVVVALWLV